MSVTEEGAVACEAKLYSYRKSRDGLIVSFVFHPNDVPDALALAPIGQRFGLGLAMLADEPAEPSTAAPRTNKDLRERARTRAVLLCEDERFWLWIGRHRGEIITTARAASDWMRRAIDADSRSRIGNSDEVCNKFLRIEEEYRQDAGLVTERRR